VAGRVDDPLEHEADRVADLVMRMANPALSVAAAPPQISRKCAACEEEEQTLHTKAAQSSEAVVGEVPGTVHDVLSSPGQTLGEATRTYFEPRFGHDFSQVRIHTDSTAADSARELGALGACPFNRFGGTCGEI
jgi:hypothetical protein